MGQAPGGWWIHSYTVRRKCLGSIENLIYMFGAALEPHISLNDMAIKKSYPDHLMNDRDIRCYYDQKATASHWEPNYCWNNQIATLRTACFRARSLRRRTGSDDENAQAIREKKNYFE